MDETNTSPSELAGLLDRLTVLEREVAELRAGGLSAGPIDPCGAPEGGGPSKDGFTPSSGEASGEPLVRRAFIGRVGALAAGAVVAGAVVSLVDETPALAAQGNFSTGTTNSYAVGATVTGGVDASGLGVDPGTNGTGVRVNGTSSNPAVLGFAAPIYRITDSPPKGAITGVNNGTLGGVGVLGASTSGPIGYGVVGIGSEAGALAYGDRSDVIAYKSGTIGFRPQPAFAHGPAGNDVTNVAGDLAVDTHGDLWYCTQSGTRTTATFRKVSGPGVAGSLHLLPAPKRVYDSRLGGQTPLNNSQRSVNTTVIGPGLPSAGTASGVPTDAVAVLVNLTATNTVADGWLAIWKNGIAFPGHSNLNWSVSPTNVANECTSAVSSGAVLVRTASRADFIIDVIGYFR